MIPAIACNSIKNFKLEKVTITSGNEIPSSAFNNCSSLISITIPDSVTSIGERAFENCYRLVEVINKSSLSITLGESSNGYIGFYAKQIIIDESDSKLSTYENGFITYNDGTDIWLVNYIGNSTEIVIPNNVTKINKYAFYNCTSLTSITILDSVTSIRDYAFYKCTSLTKVYYKGTSSYTDTITSIGDYNQSLTSATWYYFTSNGADETASGNWWYYDTDGKTIIEKVIS
jgi:hypothetical protein